MFSGAKAPSCAFCFRGLKQPSKPRLASRTLRLRSGQALGHPASISTGFADGFSRNQVFVALVMRDEIDQVLVVNCFFLVGQLGESAIGGVEIAGRQMIAEIVEA